MSTATEAGAPAAVAGCVEGEARLVAFIAAHGLAAEILHLNQPTPTVEDAAFATGVGPGAVLKTVVLADRQGGAVAVVAAGDRRVDVKAVRRLAGRGQLSLAQADEVLRLTGYPAGGVTPIGLKPGLLVLFDEASTRAGGDSGVVVAGGGSVHALLRIAVADVLHANPGAGVAVLASQTK